MQFSTVDKENPYLLTDEEEKIINKLKESFIASEKLKKHVELFINNLFFFIR